MNIHIVKRTNYSLEVDKAKNRVYYTMKGFWKHPDLFPHYFQDWEKALAEITQGFTILTNVVHLKTPTPAMTPMFERMQRILSEAGLRKTAEIFSDDVIVKMSLDRISYDSKMTKRSFNDIATAEAWLDEP